VSRILGTSPGRSSTGYLCTNHDAVNVRLVIFVDNNLYRPGLETAWDLSIYIELNNLSFLFDRGPNSKVVEANVAKLGADLFMLNFVMISHAHRDRTSRLRLVASIKPGLKVHIPPDPDFARYIRDIGPGPIAVNNTIEVSSGVYVIKPIKPLYDPPLEDAIAINTSKGLLVFIGCSTPE